MASEPLEQQPQAVVSQHVGAGTQTWVSFTTDHLPSPSHMFPLILKDALYVTCLIICALMPRCTCEGQRATLKS